MSAARVRLEPQPGAAGSSVAVAFLALAVLGHLSALWLVDVRPYAVYQHYRPWPAIVSEYRFAAAGLLVQTLVVCVLWWRRRLPIGTAWPGRVLPLRVWLLLAAIVGFSLAVPAVSGSAFLAELLVAAGIAVVAAANLVLVALLLPDRTLTRAVAWLDARITLRPGSLEPRPWDRVLPGVLAAWVVLVAAVASFMVFERVPHIDDGVSYYFQAKYFAAGRVFLPAPPDAPSFQVDQTVVDRTKWYGYGFPGWPLVLALGVKAGVPWLVNPLLGGVLVLLAHSLIRRRYDPGTANAVALLLALSPWLIFMSAEFLTHPLTAVLAVLALLAFDRAAEHSPRWAHWAVLAGAAAGALMLTRAIDAALVAAAAGAAALIERRGRTVLPAAIVAGVVAAAIGSIVLPYNRALTGHATTPPHVVWSDGKWGIGVDRLGFGPDVGIRAWPNLDPLPGHGPADVILNLNKNAFMTNVDLFGWAPGSLIFAGLAFGLSRWRRRDALMLSLSGIVIAGYSAYWFSGGPDIGARYWYPLIVPLALITVRGAQMLAAELRHRTASEAGARIGVLMVAASLSAAVVFVPWRATTKYYRYRGIGGEIRALASSRAFRHDLVFVRSDERSDYQAAFNLNPATLQDDGTIYAHDAGHARRSIVVARFADRPVWVIARQDKGAGRERVFDVIAGPLPPGTVP
jgi:hypothetical protein